MEAFWSIKQFSTLVVFSKPKLVFDSTFYSY
jgi:hypothetical protein